MEGTDFSDAAVVRSCLFYWKPQSASDIYRVVEYRQLVAATGDGQSEPVALNWSIVYKRMH